MTTLFRPRIRKIIHDPYTLLIITNVLYIERLLAPSRIHIRRNYTQTLAIVGKVGNIFRLILLLLSAGKVGKVEDIFGLILLFLSTGKVGKVEK